MLWTWLWGFAPIRDKSISEVRYVNRLAVVIPIHPTGVQVWVLCGQILPTIYLWTSPISRPFTICSIESMRFHSIINDHVFKGSKPQEFRIAHGSRMRGCAFTYKITQTIICTRLETLLMNGKDRVSFCAHAVWQMVVHSKHCRLCFEIDGQDGHFVNVFNTSSGYKTLMCYY